MNVLMHDPEKDGTLRALLTPCPLGTHSSHQTRIATSAPGWLTCPGVVRLRPDIGERAAYRAHLILGRNWVVTS